MAGLNLYPSSLIRRVEIPVLHWILRQIEEPCEIRWSLLCGITARQLIFIWIYLAASLCLAIVSAAVSPLYGTLEPEFDSQIVRAFLAMLSVVAIESLIMIVGFCFVRELAQVSVPAPTSWKRHMPVNTWPKTHLRDSADLAYGPDSSSVLGVVCRHIRPYPRGGLESGIDVRLAAGLQPATAAAVRLATLAIAASAERMYQLQHTRLRTLTASIGRALVRRCDVLMHRSFP